MPRIAPLLLLVAAPALAREQPLAERLDLDRDRPVVTAEIDGHPYRLRVDLAGKNTIDLNPGAAATLMNLKFSTAPEARVGLERLTGRQAKAVARIGGIAVPLVVTDYGHDVAADADGRIAATLLPYRSVRLARAGAGDAPLGEPLPMDEDDTTGSHVRLPTPAGPVLIQFGLDQPETVATGSAGVRLARLAGGSLGGPVVPIAGALGIPRDTRRLTFARPLTLAGRPIRSLAVRIDDFRGGLGYPALAGAKGAIVVQGRRRREESWPSVMLGRDALEACGTILLTRAPATIALGCAPE